MDFSKIRIPFLNNKIIKEKADLFRKKFWDNSVPVDIERIIELKLNINIIPIPYLQRICNTDAFIDSAWQNIRADKESYLDERYQNRLRFSLAHEIGHFVLHKNIYAMFGICSIEDLYRFFQEIPQEQYGYLETQANKFADFLLVPRGRLAFEKEKLLKEISEKINLDKIDENTLSAYLAVPISKLFGVSEQAAEIALNSIK